MDQNSQSDTGGQSTNLTNSSQQKIADDFLQDGDTYEDIIEKDILDLMGFTNLSEEKRKELHQKIAQTVENRVAARIYDALSEEERDKYDKILGMGNNDEGYEFLISREIDAAKWVAEEMIIMKLELYQDGKVISDRAKQLLKKKDQDKKGA